MKIAVCTPCHRDVKAAFASSLAGLMAHTAGATIKYNGTITRPQLCSIIASEGSLSAKRTRLVVEALAWGADYVLWADSDQDFPPEAALRLAAHDKLVVGCNYAGRFSGVPIAVGLDGERLPPAKGLAEVQALGFGLCLMKAPIFERVPKPWFAESHTDLGRPDISEDVHFCRQARSAGISVFVDHDLAIGHVAERTIYLEGEAHVRTVLPSTGNQ